MAREVSVLPEVRPITMNAGLGKKETHDRSEFATFVTQPGIGKMHGFLLKPTEERDEQLPGARAPHTVPVRGSKIEVRFAAGVYVTTNEWIIERMLIEDPTAPGYCGRGRDFDINKHDPTGYWRNHGFQFNVVEQVTITGPRLGSGPVTMASGARV